MDNDIPDGWQIGIKAKKGKFAREIFLFVYEKEGLTEEKVKNIISKCRKYICEWEEEINN